MTPIEKIQTSFSAQLSIWVAGFVMIISGVVIFILVGFSEDVIRNETIDTTLHELEHTTLQIDNLLRLSEMTARMEGRQYRVNRSRIEQLIEESRSEEMLRESLPNAQLFVTLRDSSQLDTYITGAGAGYRQLVYDNKEIYIFTQPVGDRQFNLAAVCPAQDIYGKYSRMYNILLFWGISGVLLLIYILYIVIGRHLRPLHLLADAAQGIAEGNLDTLIPDSHTEHEAGRLQTSLKKMQQSLQAYIKEMQLQQDKLNAQNAKLQAAYSEAQAYEKKKAKFLHEMTERMDAPVCKVCNCTESMCSKHEQLSPTDMADLEAAIQKGTEEITGLLDQLIKEPADA